MAESISAQDSVNKKHQRPRQIAPEFEQSFPHPRTETTNDIAALLVQIEADLEDWEGPGEQA